MGGAQQNVAFPRKLYDLIEAEPNYLIEWASHGKAFFIRDQDEFCVQVLAKYFRHTKLTSFQRQLNLYGFRRITKGPDTGAYSHPLFSRDNSEHVDTIKRVVRKGADEKADSGRWTHHHGHHKHSPPGSSPSTGSTGVSPNSPHSFPDGPGLSRSSRASTRTHRGQSWAHLNDEEAEEDVDEEGEEEGEEEGDGEYDEEEDYQPSSGRRRRPTNGNAYSKTYLTTGRGGRRGRGDEDPSSKGGTGGGDSSTLVRDVRFASNGDGEDEDGSPPGGSALQQTLSRSAPTAGFATSSGFSGGFGHGGKGQLLRMDAQPTQPLQQGGGGGVSLGALAMPPPQPRYSSSGAGGGEGSGPMSPAHSFPPSGAAGNYFFGRSASSESANMSDQPQHSAHPSAYSYYLNQQAVPSVGGGGLGSLVVPALGRGMSDTLSLAGSEQWQLDDRVLGGGNGINGGEAGLAAGPDSLLDFTALQGGGTFDDLEAFNFESSFSEATHGGAAVSGGGGAAAIMGGGGATGASNGGVAASGASGKVGPHNGNDSGGGVDDDGAAFQMDMDGT
mmetsp:Transcript_8033/g.15322  ORF Transcript_8033/g.15322 Transcript_8033/m.15322 type:complete len:556 (+) Transcript_8033:259-1926(+)